MSWSSVLHFTLISMLGILLAGFQTSFWFQMFGAIAPPLLWLVMFTYIVIYRTGWAALLQLVVLGMLLAHFSGAALKVFYLCLLSYYCLIYFIKSRIFWSGAGYFLMMCAVGSVAYHLIFTVATIVIERSHPEWLLLERATQILLTPAFAFPLFWLMQRLDSLFFFSEIKAEVTGGTAYE